MSYKLEKKLVEGFKAYLKEEQGKYQLYCDMDGVLCDFEAGAMIAMNETLAKLAADRERLEQLKPDRKNPEYILYRKAKAAVEEQGGDWGMTFDPSHIDKSIDTNKRSRDFMYQITRHSVDWWATLPWMEGAKEGLWKKILKFNPPESIYLRPLITYFFSITLRCWPYFSSKIILSLSKTLC